MAKNKIIVLGVTGSIAAHKAVDVCSLLAKTGADVHVVMTRDAQEFVTPLPFKTLSRNPVITSLYDEEEGCCGSLYQLCGDPRFKTKVTVKGGVMEKQSLTMLQDFFKVRRNV